MGTWFSQLSLLNFLELQVTPNASCWSWQNFYLFTVYPPGVCWGDSPLTRIASIPTVWGGLGGMCPHVPLWLLLFLLSGGEFWHAASFQITGQSGRGTPRKPVLYLPIVPFTQCSCPFGLEGNLGNSGLCAPMASHPPGFSDNRRWVSHTDLAPPQASCPCRSFGRLLGYCLRLQNWKQRARNAYLIRSVWDFKTKFKWFRINHFSFFFFFFKNRGTGLLFSFLLSEAYFIFKKFIGT